MENNKLDLIDKTIAKWEQVIRYAKGRHKTRALNLADASCALCASVATCYECIVYKTCGESCSKVPELKALFNSTTYREVQRRAGVVLRELRILRATVEGRTGRTRELAELFERR